MSTMPVVGSERARLVRRAKLLAWGGNWWHVGEFAIALGAIPAARGGPDSGARGDGFQFVSRSARSRGLWTRHLR